MLGVLVLLCIGDAGGMLLRGGGGNMTDGTTGRNRTGRPGKTPVVEDDTTGAGGNDRIKSVTFESRPVAVAGGYEVALVTITGDGPFLPPELAAIMPPAQGPHLHFQHLMPRRRRRHKKPHKHARHTSPQLAPTAVDNATMLHVSAGNISVSNSSVGLTTTSATLHTRRRHALDRFLHFISKQQKLLKHLSHSRRDLTGPASGALAAAAIGGLKGNSHAGNSVGKFPGKFRRNHDESDDLKTTSEEVTERPMVHVMDANQLDLSPARGSRIANMRLRGRICQRSVLQHEGPGYGTDGKIHIFEFAKREQNRDFHATRAPSFMLPICCNCCSKSVLGCE